jgi:hypothetical protein
MKTFEESRMKVGGGYGWWTTTHGGDWISIAGQLDPSESEKWHSKVAWGWHPNVMKWVI